MLGLGGAQGAGGALQRAGAGLRAGWVGGAGGLERGWIPSLLQHLQQPEKRAKGAVRNSAEKFQSGQPLISCLERFLIECAHRT